MRVAGGKGGVHEARAQTVSDERSKRLIAEQWPIFTEAVLSRLRVGAAEYGDESLDADPDRLAREIQEELLDVMGWAFLLWAKMQAIHDKAKLAGIHRNSSPGAT